MKIDQKTLEQMTVELKSAFKVMELAGVRNPTLSFIDGTDGQKLDTWVKLHCWSCASIEHVNAEQRHCFKEFPFNERHELYPCGTNDNSLLTGLNWIAKHLTVEWDTVNGSVCAI